MSLKMTIIIVVYNKEIQASIACCSLLEMGLSNLDILIVDNSDIKTNNEDYCCKNKIRYLNMGGNAGLSKAYNRAIDASMSSDIYVFMDDDTEITPQYFSALAIALKQNPETDIFAPIVFGQDGVIYSPNEFRFLKNRFKSCIEDKVQTEKFNAIASCLAVRARVFSAYRFDESLFVDQVDQYFFCQQRKLKTRCMELEVVIQQNFYQRGETLSAQAGWSRLKLRIVDVMHHAKLMGHPKYLFLGYIKCCGLGVQIGRKSHSLGIVFKAVGLGTQRFWMECVGGI